MKPSPPRRESPEVGIDPLADTLNVGERTQLVREMVQGRA